MSAKHGAKESAAWTRELDVILLDGIEDNRQGKDLARERVKALHPLPQGKDRYPKDFEKWLAKVFEKPSEDECELPVSLRSAAVRLRNCRGSDHSPTYFASRESISSPTP